jgi:hypothetical protein
MEGRPTRGWPGHFTCAVGIPFQTEGEAEVRWLRKKTIKKLSANGRQAHRDAKVYGYAEVGIPFQTEGEAKVRWLRKKQLKSCQQMEGRPTKFQLNETLSTLESPFKPKAKPRFADSEKKQLKSCQQMEGRPTNNKSIFWRACVGIPFQMEGRPTKGIFLICWTLVGIPFQTEGEAEVRWLRKKKQLKSCQQMEGRPTHSFEKVDKVPLESPFKPKAKPRFADSEKKQLKSCQQMEGRPTWRTGSTS